MSSSDITNLLYFPALPKAALKTIPADIILKSGGRLRMWRRGDFGSPRVKWQGIGRLGKGHTSSGGVLKTGQSQNCSSFSEGQGSEGRMPCFHQSCIPPLLLHQQSCPKHLPARHPCSPLFMGQRGATAHFTRLCWSLMTNIYPGPGDP